MKNSGTIVNIVWISVLMIVWFALAITYFVWSTEWYYNTAFCIGIGVLFTIFFIGSATALGFTIEYLIFINKGKTKNERSRNLTASILGIIFTLSLVGSILMMVGYNEKVIKNDDNDKNRDKNQTNNIAESKETKQSKKELKELKIKNENQQLKKELEELKKK